MGLDLRKVANVFDAFADYVEENENQKTSAVRAQRTAEVDKLAEQYTAATGEEMPDTIRHKLSSADRDIVAMFNNMVSKHAETVAPLGGPSSKDDEHAAPMNAKEAAEAAEQKFLSWITT